MLNILRIATVTLFTALTTVNAQSAPSLRPRLPVDRAFLVLSGNLHDHSTDSDGNTPDNLVVAWHASHRSELGTDFETLSEHSDVFPLAAGSPGSLFLWPHQGALMQQYSRGGFSFLRAFEYTDDQENHLNVIGSQNWLSAVETKFGVTPFMPPFYKWLATAPTHDPSGNGFGFGGADGLGQFNHPSIKGALNWDDYGFNAAAAPYMATIEIHGDQGRGGVGSSDAGWYWFALSQGWTVSPVMDWDQHDYASIIAAPAPGTFCGVAGYLPCQRTLVLATAATPSAIMDAIRARRTSASEVPDLWGTLRTASGAIQGTTVSIGHAGTLRLVVDAGSQSTRLTSIDIVADNGISPFPYYYGDNAPCRPEPTYTGDPANNCNPNNYVQAQLTFSYVLQHERYVASGGHATKKAQIDAPPPGTIVASVPIRATLGAVVPIEVRVPATPSTRPDGKHFFYAIVHAGTARVWTGPILTTR
ncbi:MAG: hypothetical protein NVSMB64_14200 [Candidatus Velthaea sp.]